ncbi:MAG: DUF1592 domain-containing protein [Nannocystaceae bacterium]|nr:DUF1592 domain-containing protein [Nannocystaceae bacterium]
MQSRRSAGDKGVCDPTWQEEDLFLPTPSNISFVSAPATRGLRLLLAAAVLAPGCYEGSTVEVSPYGQADPGDGTGSDGGDGDGETGDATGGESASCETLHPGPRRLRRLTRSAYANAVQDLLEQSGEVADGFEADGIIAKTFDSNVDVLPSDLTVENYQRAAEELAEAVTGNLAALSSCDPLAEGDEPCAHELIDRLGRRAWRRALSDAEHERMFELWSSEDGFDRGGARVVEALLQSPYFLYQLELGTPTDDPAVLQLTQQELAMRLSMLVWNSIPDDALLDVAEAGELDTTQEVLAQVERMLDDPRARRSVAHFAEQWVGLPDLPRIADLYKNSEVFPAWTTSLRDAMAIENALFVDSIVRGGGTVEDLLTSSLGFVDDELAAHYGLDIAEASQGAPEIEGLPEGFVAVLHDPGMRPGILTRAGTMAMLAKPNGTGPVHRGAFVQERLFCRELVAPPPSANTDPPEPDPNVPRREQYAQHSDDLACSSCHVLTDPIGFGLEHYDATGALQLALANGEPFDVSGDLAGTDVDGPFVAAAGLRDRMVESESVRACVAKTWFRYAFAAHEEELDACTVEQLTDALEEGATIRELIGAIAVSHAFRTISAQ